MAAVKPIVFFSLEFLKPIGYIPCMNKELTYTVSDDEQHDDNALCSDGDVVVEVPVVPETFSVRDEETASWLCRKINECRAYRRRVELWAARELKRAERDEAFLMMKFGRQLEDWTASEITRLRGRRRSLCLPGGTVGFRRTGPLLVVTDSDAVLRWAKRNCPAAVVVKEVLSKTTLNAHVAESGELPDGSHLQEPQDKFFLS
jgi:hypothetical protein